jgi:hypothetical protein
VSAVNTPVEQSYSSHPRDVLVLVLEIIPLPNIMIYPDSEFLPSRHAFSPSWVKDLRARARNETHWLLAIVYWLLSIFPPWRALSAVGSSGVELRTFGDTGLKVSPIGLGMAALGRPGYINLGHAHDLGHDYDVPAMERRAHTVLDAAWSTGIRYFDAARSYGLGEQFLGTWLKSRGVRPESVTVGSKWGYTYTADLKIETQAHEI